MKLYFRYLGMLLRCQMQYRLSFLMTIIGQFLVSFTAFAGVYFMLARFHRVDGYSFSEILICFSVVVVAFDFAECFFRGFDSFQRLINSGSLDRLLVRPRGVVFQVLTSSMEFSRIGRLAQAVIMLVYALLTCEIDWNPARVLTLILMLVSGVTVFASLFVMHAGVSFFTIEGLEFTNILTDGSREFARYPLSIYGRGILRIYTYVVPIALFQYWPFLYLTGRSEDMRLMLAPLAAMLFVIPCAAVFRLGLRKYQSAGS